LDAIWKSTETNVKAIIVATISMFHICTDANLITTMNNHVMVVTLNQSFIAKNVLAGGAAIMDKVVAPEVAAPEVAATVDGEDMVLDGENMMIGNKLSADMKIYPSIIIDTQVMAHICHMISIINKKIIIRIFLFIYNII
jgi:hypothetical protein